MALIVAVGCSSCMRKRVTVDMKFKPEDNGSVQCVYYAWSSGKSAVLEANIAVMNGAGNVKLPVIEPTVILLFSFSDDPVGLLYVERGDKFEISGSLNDPLGWKIEGNDVTGDLNAWLHDNRQILTTRNAAKINSALTSLVKNAPGKLSTGILLILYFDRSYAPEKFVKLWNSLDKDIRESEIVKALGASRKLSNPSAATTGIKPARFYSLGDSVVTVVPGQHPYTVFFFWEREGEHSSAASRLRKALAGKSNVGVVDVNMSADTIGWRGRMRMDSVSGQPGWKSVWAPGAEADPSLAQFDVSRNLFFILIDRNGRQLYRGASPEEMKSKIR